MRAVITGPRPDFFKEMQDVVDVFFPLTADRGEQSLQVLHEEGILEGQRWCRLSLSGAFSGQGAQDSAVMADPVADKRYHKRQVKLALYHALKEATGQQPAWGALTGVRPTRLIYEALAEGLSLEEASRRIMAQFDVQPQQVELLAEVVACQLGLPQAGPQDVDIYIGIPFCPSRCRYCSFISMQVGRGELLAPYTEALLREIEGAVQLLQDTGMRPRAFYMGGGTPTALSAGQLARLLRAAKPLMQSAAERTVEAGRPDSITREKLQVILQAGVERLSVNPQTSFDSTLQAIGRAHSRQETEQAYGLARQLGFTNINMDLIAGLPGENTAMFEDTLVWIGDLAPDNLTVHTLCLKRSSDMHRLQDSLPDAQQVTQMVQMGRGFAKGLGMAPYYLYRQKHMAGNQANVGYALPGKECLYNVDTMEDNVSVLALGAGGISKRVTAGRQMVYRAPNVKEVRNYIARVDEMLDRKRAVFSGI